ncbi:MAG: two pore domain potassium channel family protein [Desulfobacteraceae bacterium]|nr:MAG: two pore domain potassium channel family protein [Desulfobacteraceae bacterium]
MTKVKLRSQINEGFTIYELCSWQAFYFSVVTITTLGFGDIHPNINAWHIQLFTILEVIVGLYFLITILTIFVSWAVNEPRRKISLKDLAKKVSEDQLQEEPGVGS